MHFFIIHEISMRRDELLSHIQRKPMPRTHTATMYRSRFRCNKAGPAVPHRGTRTTIYTNRMNRHVIDRMLEVGKKRHATLGQERHAADVVALGVLDTQLSQLTPSELAYYTSRQILTTQRETLVVRIQDYESGAYMRSWDNMTRVLHNRPDSHIGRLVLSNRIMGRPTEHFYTDPDKCTHCHVLYEFDQVSNDHTCPQCGYTVQVLFITEDISQDSLINKDPNTGVTTKVPGSEYHYVRSPLYKRYLKQFGMDVPPIPLEAMRILYKYLSNIHLQNSVRCRPTPVANILRTHGFVKWASFSIRITKLFNGEAVPVLPPDLIQRLVRRFGLIFHESSTQKQKLPSFEFITNILLRIEGRTDLAGSFALHKTRSVLRRIASELYVFISRIKASGVEPDLLWEQLPVF